MEMTQRTRETSDRCRRGSALLLAGLALTLGLRAQDEKPVGVKEMLKQAAAIQREANGKKGEERVEILLRAVAAYDGIAKDHAEEKAAAQESLFRAAGILRALARFEEARQRYQRSVEINGNRSYTARSMLELGHLCRRQSDFKGALQWYEKTAKEFAALLPYRDDAQLWSGKVHERIGNHQRAREAWEVVARGGESTIDRIQAFDLMARSLLGEGNSSRARELVEECDRTFADEAQVSTSHGRQVARALERMRAKALLEDSEKKD